MTRTTTTLISVLAAGAMALAFGSVAMASDYSSVSATVGAPTEDAGQAEAYSSPAALVGGGEAGSAEGSLTAIMGSDGVTSAPVPEATVATSSDSFDWTDALIGGAVSLGLALTTFLLVGAMRRRTRVEPSF
jgi:hypothetical protein